MSRTHRTIILSGCFLFSSACAEDSLLRLPDSVPMTQANNPDVVLDSPHQVSLTTTSLSSHCDGEDVSVQIENQGLWTVFVEALERQHPEVMEIVPINQRLAPGEALEVVVSALPGQHDFTVTLRDHASLEHSLSVAAPVLPTVTILEPTSGAIFAEAEDVEVVVEVTDAFISDGAPEVTLMRTDGSVVAELVADADGLYRYTWLASERALGEQQLQAKVRNVCEAEAQLGVDVCQDATLKTLGVWQLTAVDAALTDEAYLGEIWSFEGDLNAAENFNYYSASAHPIVGPDPTGFETHVFFYEGPDGLSLNFFSNKDEGGHADWVSLDIDIQVTGNGLLDDVILSDDSGELSRQVTAMSADASHYNGRFRYVQNTDGGVIGPLAGEDFEVRFTIVSATEERGASFYSSNGTSIDLMTENGITSFAIAYRSDTLCGLFGDASTGGGPGIF